MVINLSTSAGGIRSVTSMPEETPIVFVVDDDISIRESLELLIRSAGWEAELFENAGQFLSRPRSTVANCLVLDVNMPDLSGLDLQSMVATERTEMPIIFITGFGDVPSTVKAMKAGAVEFLTKPYDDDTILSAIGQALERSRTALAADAEMRTLRARHASLSRREQEVMALVVTGLLNKQVAYELSISEVTVKAHRGRMMEKMQAQTFADLTSMARKLGLTQ